MLTPGVKCYTFDALKKGRRCGIDDFGFFLSASDSRAGATPVTDLPQPPKSAVTSPTATPATAEDQKPDSESDDDLDVRGVTLKQVVAAQSGADGVAWWRAIAAQVTAEADKAQSALRSSRRRPSSATADLAGSPESTPSSSLRVARSQHVSGRVTPWAQAALLKARRRVRKRALPMEERRVAWQLLTGALFKPTTEDEYQALLDTSIGADSEEVMLRDLGRTLPLHCLFKDDNSPGQQSLRRVLHAYCARDPEVGYCQGMGFIASMLLLHMDEPSSFGVLWQLMHGRHYLMRQLYQQGFPLLQKMLGILRSLLRRFLPQVHDHFADLGIEPAFYASHWFLTLYAYQFPVPLVCRIWDLFVSEGWKIIFKVAIALLQWEEQQLVQMTMENVLLLVKTIQENKDPEVIIARAMSLPIKERDLFADPPETDGESET